MASRSPSGHSHHAVATGEDKAHNRHGTELNNVIQRSEVTTAGVFPRRGRAPADAECYTSGAFSMQAGRVLRALTDR